MIYLDNNATTRIAPEVRDAMLPWLDDHYGNPSAGYRFGRESRKAIENAREQVSALIAAHPEEIVFTSGGTESNNTAIRSALAMRQGERGIVTSVAEHSAVDEVVKRLGEEGCETSFVPVNEAGLLDLDAWSEAVAGENVVVASLIWANNETGVLSPLDEAISAAEKSNVYCHTDAVQAVGKIPVKVGDFPLHALSLSAHKFHGPKGIGALWLNRNTRFHPLILGGGQEDERRSGTENVPAIVGMGVAAELALEALVKRQSISTLRDRFESGVLKGVEGVEINGDPSRRLPNTSNLYFPGVDGEGLLILLDEAGVCCSPGSACSTGAVQPSRIVKAMGHSSARARSSVRFSLSRFSTEEEIDVAIGAIQTAVSKLRVVMPTGSRVVTRSNQ